MAHQRRRNPSGAYWLLPQPGRKDLPLATARHHDHSVISLTMASGDAAHSENIARAMQQSHLAASQLGAATRHGCRRSPNEGVSLLVAGMVYASDQPTLSQGVVNAPGVTPTGLVIKFGFLRGVCK